MQLMIPQAETNGNEGELMLIKTVSHINREENDRVEYLIVNFEYRDAIDFMASFFQKEFNLTQIEEIDGWWYRILKLRRDSDEYCLVWHEDVGSYMYSVKQDDASLREFEHMVNTVIGILNSRFGRKDEA